MANPGARVATHGARVAFAVAVGVNLVAVYAPSAAGAGLFPHADKVAHLLVFAAVAATGVPAGVPIRWLAGLLVAHAVLSEIVQAVWLTQRSGDPGDVVADLVGIGLGLVVGRRLPGRR